MAGRLGRSSGGIGPAKAPCGLDGGSVPHGAPGLFNGLNALMLRDVPYKLEVRWRSWFQIPKEKL
mgnify:CR=1 FL=1